MKDVYLLSGFLGSGKTTLLVKWLTYIKQQGLKPAVIMNELGALGFDSDAVEEDVPLRELLEGCICCSPAEKTEAQIQQILHQEEFDVLLIETTGAAHPVASLDVILSPLFADHFDFKGIVTVVDAVRFLERDKLPIQTKALFFEQIKHGHLLVLNKVDLLEPEELEEVQFSLSQLNAKAKIVPTTYSTVDFSQLQHLAPSLSAHEPMRVGMELTLGTRHEVLSSSFPQYAVEGWIQSLPETVYRVKGYIQLPSTSKPLLFQYAYGMTQWMQEDVNVKTQLVVIGENLTACPTLETYQVLSTLKKIYPERERLTSLSAASDIDQVIDDELLDVQTHPRTRQTLEQKNEQLRQKVTLLDCSKWEEEYFLRKVTERFNELSTRFAQ